MVELRKSSPQMQALWHRLVCYDFDCPEHHLSFAKRLARENNWSDTYTAQAIDEYRRFCFLVIHAGHPVTPCDAVDQVWHLHLTYTRDYWDRFCPDVLEQPLHHDPTLGGENEASKFEDWYSQTLHSYHRFFGPPSSIWPSTRERFADADAFVRAKRADVLPFTLEAKVLGVLSVLSWIAAFFYMNLKHSPLVTMALIMGTAFVVVFAMGANRWSSGRSGSGSDGGGGGGCGGCGGG